VAEAQISAQLQHPNIVSVLDFDRDPEQRLFLVMELVEGKDLDALMGTGLLPFPVVIFLISEVLRGLGYAHDLPVGNESRGVVHRDISPHNVLLSWAGTVKVSDFGIAKARAASEATASVFIKGKPAYMSPEQANGQALDGRSDLFAVGIMLWEMLVGRRLFTGEDTRATLASVLFGQIPRPRSLRADVPKDLERITMKLLERDLAARYPTAEAALADLFDCADTPKGGAQLLTATLAERFYGEAPVRQSLLNQPRPKELAAMLQTPVPGSYPQPAAALPSIGSLRNAPTGTIDHAPRSRGKKLALVLAVTLGSGLATFAVVSIIKSKKSEPPTVAAVGSDAAASVGPPPVSGDAVSTAPVTDAPAPQPADAAVPIDAIIPEPPPDAKKDAPPPRPPEKKRYGSITIASYPAATIYVDGAMIGDTTRTLKLTTGRHHIALKNPESGVDVAKDFTIVETKPETWNYKKP
jgi:hypothetical protein